LNELEINVKEKDKTISFPNAVSDPWAMVVVSCNTMITFFAMLGS
jgi:hypothetical protein